jgi:ribosomal-protein-alanine N-acetyltransferase
MVFRFWPIANCQLLFADFSMLTAKNTIVRPAVAEDLPGIIEIAQQSAAAAQWNAGEYERMLLAGPFPSTCIVLVIGEDGVSRMIYGFLVAKEVAGEWEIENLAVRESARRRGLGVHLLHEFLRLVHSRHGREVYLEVRESNVAARALYAKCTFIEAGKRKSYYHNPEEDALVLKFSFSQKL